MAFNASKIKNEGGNFDRPDPLEPGAYPARVVQIISLGVQPQRAWQGKEKPPRLEIRVTYELLDEFLTDEDGKELGDKPRFMSETFALLSLDSDKARSTERYLALDPTMEHGGDWAKLIGTPCMVNVVQNKGKGKHEGKIFDNVGSISGMRPKEAAKASELVNDPKVFDFDEPDLEVFFSLSQFIQDKIKESLEFSGSDLEKLIEEQGDKYKKSDDEKVDDQSDTDSEEDDEDGDDW